MIGQLVFSDFVPSLFCKATSGKHFSSIVKLQTLLLRASFSQL